ncbi:MAG: glycoside hydrolase domain-containing protein, partial [Thermoleophilia bacterium]
HGVSPTVLQPLPTFSSSGAAPENDLASGLSPWLDGSGLDGQGFLDTQFPLRLHFPFDNWTTDRGKIETYVADMVRFYRAHGWGGRTYAYVVDEPRQPGQIRMAEKVAEIIHAGSAKAGYREPVLMTDEPRTRTLSGAPPNQALWKDVDIWCPRIFHFWDDLANLRHQQAKGKQIWWYNYASHWSGRFPSWLIDKPNTDIRAQEWMAAVWGVTGTLYYDSDRWTNVNGKGYRDPYRNTASFGSFSSYIANGEASFIYPGYEPSLGLKDPLAGPVSSLRMEALRSGLQDYQYYQIARALARRSTLPGVAAYPARVAAAVTSYQYGSYPLQWKNVPGWSNNPATYTNAKVHLGVFIERLQAGEGLVVARGTVRDAATGKPVSYATVSDGIVSATTAANGSFSLSGVLPQARLSISQPRYATAYASYNEGDPAITVALTPIKPIRVLSSFESAAAFNFPNAGSATLSTLHATTGRKSAKLVFRSWRTAWSLSASAGRLGAFHELDLDVYNPQADVKYHEWFLYLTATDAHGRQITQRILLAPHAWNHLRLSLHSGSFDRRAVRTIGMYVYPVRNQTIYVDTVFAK